MEINGKNITVSILALLLCACGGEEHKPTPKGESAVAERRLTGWLDRFSVTGEKVRVGSDKFALAGQPAVSIHVGTDNNMLLDIYLQRVHFLQGNRVHTKSANNPELAMTAIWQGLKYVESDTHPTYATVLIRSITSEKVVFHVSARLVNPETGRLLNLSRSVVNIKGQDLKAVLADN